MIIRFCTICIFLSGICSIGKAQSRLTKADSLALSGQYLSARVAYERILFTEKDPATQYRASLGKARCLKQQGLYAQAVAYLTTQLQAGYADSLQQELRREQIVNAYLAGQFENTLALLDQLAYLYPNAPPPTLLMAIRTLALNELQRWHEASQAYAVLAGRVGVDTAATTNPYRQLPQFKSLTKAQWLATFIPGGGQFYAGKPGEALLSIVAQGAGLYFGIASYLSGYYLSAWGVGAGLFGSFHAGGIRRSEVLVRQINKRRSAAFNTAARQAILQLIP